MNPAIRSIVIFASSAAVLCTTGAACGTTDLPVVGASGASIASIFQLVFGVIGSLAVLIIVVAGLRFILANGDPQTVSQARNTIIYAAVGLAIAVSAEIIVTFVLGHV